MILCEFTPDGGSMQRLAMLDVPLTYQWLGLIQSISSVKMQTSQSYGGYVRPTFSDIKLSPDVFSAGSWPPPKGAGVKLMWTESSEAAAETIYDGKALLRGDFDRETINYKLSGPEFDSTVPSGTAFADTLVNVMTALCGASYLNLTLVSSAARSPSPTVSYTTTDDMLAIDLADQLAAFFGHAFRIDGTTMTMVDLLGTGSGATLTEFDFGRVKYSPGTQLALVTSDDGSAAGSWPDGETVSITPRLCAAVNVDANLANLVSLIEADVAALPMRITSGQPVPLDLITLTDTSTVQDTNFTGRVLGVTYNFDNQRMELEVMGAIT